MKKYLPETVLLFTVAVFFASSLLSDFEILAAFVIKGVSLLIGLLAFLFIIADKYKKRYYKTSVLIVLCVFAGIYFLSLPYLFRYSVKLYIYRNESELMEMNKILLSKNTEISIRKIKGIDDKAGSLNTDERDRLNELMKLTGNYWVSKYDGEINYELNGFLDNRHGIIYSEKEQNNPKKEKLAENWYLYLSSH